ncbi:MAG: hypothetical protein AB1473_20745 [Thermodesulfobacteriota bacterium]
MEIDTTYIIAGFGKFGRLALERLSRCKPESRLFVVDNRADLADVQQFPYAGGASKDAVEFLMQNAFLDERDIVIPMVPFHLAARYVLARDPDIRETVLPPELETVLPNAARWDPSTVTCSRADFVCPDDCPEGDVCTVTGEPRSKPLYEELRRLKLRNFRLVVQRSYQILPGVGGYLLGDLDDLPARITKGKSVLATSCRCHGLLTALER